MIWNERASAALAEGLHSLSLPPLTPRQEERFAIYADFLVEYNQKVNLTAIVDPVEIAIKHFVDSLTILKVVEPTPGQLLIDIGSGAGFPGVPLLIVHPELRVTLLDALAKRLTFLELLLTKLELNAHLVHARAEDAARQQGFRGRFDWATARAVSGLAGLLEYSVPFLNQGGSFIAQKGPSGLEELRQANRAMSALGIICKKQKQLVLPLQEDGRLILVFEKIKNTPSIYPRTLKQIRENPL